VRGALAAAFHAAASRGLATIAVGSVTSARSLRRPPHRHASEALARTLPAEIIRRAGVTATAEQATWKSCQARAFMLLRKHDEEAVRLATSSYHYEDAEALFPWIFTASRRAAPASREKAAAPAAKGAAAPIAEPA
jgi:hypothetical protein